jgi:hypothetical protein
VFVCLSAGLQAGKIFHPDEPGEQDEEDAEGSDDDDDDDDDEDAAEQQQQQTGAGRKGTARQQQQQQARQDTLQKKIDSDQEDLTFMSYDRAVLAQLPPFIQQQVPFITTAKGAIDLQLLEYMKSMAASGVSFSNITNRLQERTHTQHYSRMLTYYSFAGVAEAAAVASRGEKQLLSWCCDWQLF